MYLCTLTAAKFIPWLSGFPPLLGGRIQVVFKEWVESIFPNSGFKHGVCKFQENGHKTVGVYPLIASLVGLFL